MLTIDERWELAGRTPAPMERPVSLDVAIADARYVLRWLIQMHECEHTRLTLPANIEALARRAVSVFGG